MFLPGGRLRVVVCDEASRREASRGEAIARRGGADTFAANMNFRKPSTPVPVIECLARSVPVPFESASLLTDA